MVRGSKRYTQLERRLKDLHRHLLAFLPLPNQFSKTSYSPQELDLTRSYVVLAHAEIEAFCEDLVITKTDKARRVFRSQKRVTPTLRRVLSYHVCGKGKSWNEVLAPTPQTVKSALQSYRDLVRNNHGVKRENLEKLFYPVGLMEPDLDATWLAQINSFGSSRGEWAHKSIGALNPPDPASALKTVSGLPARTLGS